MKVFDKVFSHAPFLHKSISSDNMFLTHFYVLSFLLLGSSLIFGYAVLITLLIAYSSAFVVVWIYHCFDDRFFFHSILWHNTLLTYVLLLPPRLEWQFIVLGVCAIFILGQGILSVNKRAIINPVLLGILAALSFQFYGMNTDNILTAPILVKDILNYNRSFGNDNIWMALVDAYHIIAGWEQLSFIYQQNIEAYTQLINNIPVGSVRDIWYNNVNPWFGTNSLILLGLAYLILSVRKVINYKYPFLYVGMYVVSSLLISILSGLSFGIDELIICLNTGILWFCAVFLVTDYMYAPMNEKGRIISICLAAVLTCLLNIRYYSSIHYIVALIIVNIGASLIELLNVSIIFGRPKKSFFYFLKKYVKIGKFKNEYYMRLGMGIIIIVMGFSFNYFISNDTFTYREERYYYELVKDIFPQYTIQEAKNYQVYQALGEDREDVTIVYSKVRYYRGDISLVAVIQDNIIEEIEWIYSGGEYPSNVQKRWVQDFVGLKVTDLSMSLQKEYISNRQMLSYSGMGVRYILEAVINIKTILNAQIDNKDQQ